jgi:hypothetical protein
MATFKVDYDKAERELARELELLGATSAYISTDQELRMDGRPRRDRQPGSSAVAVYFVRKGQQLCIPCDKFYSVRDNLRAIGLTLQNIRQMERYGTSQTVEATLSGFAALPAQARMLAHAAGMRSCRSRLMQIHRLSEPLTATWPRSTIPTILTVAIKTSSWKCSGHFRRLSHDTHARADACPDRRLQRTPLCPIR